MKRKASTLIELMVGIIITGIVFGGIFTIFLSLNGAQTFSTTMPTVQQQAQQMALTIAGAVRRSTLCASSDTGCTLDATVQDTSTTGLTVYSRSGSTLVPITYAVSSGDFQKTVADGAATTIYSGSTLALTYYRSSSYHLGANAGLTEYTPTSSTTKDLVAVKIVTTITSGSMGASYSTVVRLRNSPKKTSPAD